MSNKDGNSDEEIQGTPRGRLGRLRTVDDIEIGGDVLDESPSIFSDVQQHWTNSKPAIPLEEYYERAFNQESELRGLRVRINSGHRRGQTGIVMEVNAIGVVSIRLDGARERVFFAKKDQIDVFQRQEAAV